MIGFIASALLVVTTVLPRAPKQQTAGQGVYSKTTRGVRFYLRTPRLRGLLAQEGGVAELQRAVADTLDWIG